MEFELDVVSLDDALVYTALSYTWGDPKGVKPICVNGSSVLVTENLGNALCHLQHADISPALWIDPICMDLTDYDEKQAQVKMMGAIFPKAARVLVWLGPETEKSDFSAHVLHVYGEEVRRKFNVPSPPKWTLYEYIDFENFPEMLEFIESVTAIAAETTGAIAVLSAGAFFKEFIAFLIDREWWYRAWVLQEFVFAREVHFQIGRKRLDLDEVSTLSLLACLNLREKVFQNSVWNEQTLSVLLPCGGLNWIMYMFVYRERRNEKRSPLKVIEMMYEIYCQPVWPNDWRYLTATDRRDCVFALLSLAKNDYFDTLGMEVDYKHDWQHTYSEFAQRLIADGNLDLLTLCQAKNLCPDLPTWVPRWHERIPFPHPWFTTDGQGKMLRHSLFAAASSMKIEVSFRKSLSQDGVLRSMHIHGFLVDEVEIVKSAYLRSSSTQPHDLETTYRKLFREIEYLCVRSGQLEPQVYTPEQLKEAAWRIPIWDHELPDVEDEDGVYKRASQTSFLRHKECLPLFEAVEKYTGEESASMRNVSQHPLVAQNFQPNTRSYLMSMQLGLPMKPFTTNGGYIGLGPVNLKPGDAICIFLGSNVPHILRKRENNQSGYILVGEAFVYGLMDGEVMSLDRETTKFEVF